VNFIGWKQLFPVKALYRITCKYDIVINSSYAGSWRIVRLNDDDDDH